MNICNKHQLYCLWIGVCVLILTWSSSLWAQTPRLPQSLRSYVQPPTAQLENIEAAPIFLDGRPLFSLTAAKLEKTETSGKVLSPIQSRVQTVRQQLKAIAARKIKPKDLQITYDIKSIEENRAIASLQINGQYVLTINSMDAELYSTDVESHAMTVQEDLETALTAYYEERQPAYVQRKGLQSLGIIALALLSTLGFRSLHHYGRHRLNRRLDQLTLQEPIRFDVMPSVSSTERDHAVEQTQRYNQIQDRKNRIKFRYDAVQKGLNFLLLVIWVGSLSLVLSFFPQTRAFNVLVLDNALRTALEVVLCIFGTYLLIRLSFLAIDYAFSLFRTGHLLSPHRPVRSLLRLQTLAGYLKSICVTGLTLGGLFLILSLNGIDLGPLLAGAGLLGLAVSFGAQNLIRDIINGLFLIWEDQFGVGDVVTINDVAGAVEAMNLRITQLRSQDGDLITIPNGRIEMVKNHSNQWSRANLGIEIAYDTDVDQAIELIRQTALALSQDPRWQEAILEPPEILGVDAFSDNSLTIRLWIKTAPLKQWEVSREFRLRLKHVFDQEDIHILFPRHHLFEFLDPK